MSLLVLPMKNYTLSPGYFGTRIFTAYHTCVPVAVRYGVTVNDELCASAQVVCVGSIAELEQLTGVKVTDLHRET